MYSFFNFLVAAAPVIATLNLKHLRPALVAQHGGLPTIEFASGEAKRAAAPPKFLNNRTRPFAVKGDGIPEIGWDVGESYAGSLPLSNATNDKNKLFYWFFPSTNPAADKEITIWLTGGPGCSSIGELLQENGPFLWQPGVYRPVENVWSWHKLTNMVWIDQPVGSGFSDGEVTAKDEADVARQFMGFWKNFVETFSLQGYKVYITGSSYSGMYSSYIASAMLDANDTTYFNVSGMLVFDGLIGHEALAEDLPAVSFVDSWEHAFNFNATFKQDLRAAAQACGYTDYLKKYLVFPPAGRQPVDVPSTRDGAATSGCDLFEVIIDAVQRVNPCFSPYTIFDGCPRPYDPIGFTEGTLYQVPGAGPAYFNRPDVKRAINAPDKDWFFCNDGTNGPSVFVDNNDLSLNAGPGAQPVIPNIIERTKNVIFGHGARDFVLVPDGTLLTIQNMTWGGMLGFQEKPSAPLVIPELSRAQRRAIDLGFTSGGGSGVLGTVHSERGLTYFGADTTGHFLARDAPQVAFRALEVLLGRVKGLESGAPFTVDLHLSTSGMV